MDPLLVARPIDAVAREAIRARATAIHESIGVAPLGEATWRDLEEPGPESFVVEDGDTIVHAMHGSARWTLGVVPGTSSRAALDAALAAVAERSADPVTVWVTGADRPDRAAITADLHAAGLGVARRLLRLEVVLPIEPRPFPEGTTVRGFDPTTDADAWLAVNNRAFVEHPEQGGWDAATFAARRAEPWFRSDDLRVALLEDRLVASCWTKRTDDPGRPPIGEIYVVGVDPSAQGLGLGPAIVTEGLDHLARRCGARIGMLYVDAANAPAVGLYDRLGFTPVREDHAFEVPR